MSSVQTFTEIVLIYTYALRIQDKIFKFYYWEILKEVHMLITIIKSVDKWKKQNNGRNKNISIMYITGAPV